MKKLSYAVFEGERPLFGEQDLLLDHVTILPGESALKETTNIMAVNCEFNGKYPFWHTHGFQITDCLFGEGARAALWYSDGLTMQDTLILAPKMFREMQDLTLTRIKLPHAAETLWYCRKIKLEDVQADEADYILLGCEDILVHNFTLNGNYSFQKAKNVVIHNSVLNSKDAFWESENVTVYDSVLDGEYLGWHSKNLRLVNCKISGTQPLCYAENLVLENCTMTEDADLAFEYSSVKADIRSRVTSIKNPLTGQITCDGCDEIIIDEHLKKPGDCKITFRA